MCMDMSTATETEEKAALAQSLIARGYPIEAAFRAVEDCARVFVGDELREAVDEAIGAYSALRENG